MIRPTMNGHVVSPKTNNQPVFLAFRKAENANASKMGLFLRTFRLLALSSLALLLIISTSGTCSFGQSNPETPPISTEMKQFAPGVLVAVIGEEYVLAGDLLALIETQLQEIKDRASETQYAEIRDKMMRQALAQVVQSKMLAQYFINEQVTGKPLHERIEANRQMDKRVSEAFFEAVVPQMMKSQKVETPLELDRSLREEGTSLEAQKRVFRDSTFAQEALKKNVPKKFDIDALSMRDYYDSHLDEFRRPARARFRELAALYSQAGGVDEARRLIEQMGNEVFLGGAPFEAVAKKSSHGYKASEGGVYEWLTEGSLKNEQVDAAVFSIPVRRLSKIIEENDGLRIIEVLEREPERIVSFEEAQAEIKDILSKQRGKQAKDALVEKLKRNTSIWSLWPDDIPGARPLSDLSLAKESGKP
ncbi:MAG: peptidylprolyl isomerase [Pirellulaceae bacterium]|nr:peptidylprolyl isomerase [Pirellulaceae bacterium]